MKYIFTNILGSFVLTSDITIIDSVLFSTLPDSPHLKSTDTKLQKKHGTLHPLPPDKLTKALTLFKNSQYFPKFKEFNLTLTKEALRKAITEDHIIVQTISAIEEIDKVLNLLTKRLREWYSLYYPELSETISNPETFVELTLSQKRPPDTIGADLNKTDLQEIRRLAERIQSLHALRQEHEQYLTLLMKKYCPNLLELTGATIGAKLIELAKGLKRLALFPASTVQLLGAEKALFRHIQSGSRSPKYGVIFNHQFVQTAPRQFKGKAARMLADKISLCARLDFFHGEFKAPEYKKELESAWS